MTSTIAQGTHPVADPSGSLAGEYTVALGRLDLWLVRPPEERAAGLDCSELDEGERRRAASFIRPADGLLYAAAHVALRRLLGRYTGIAPQDVRFVREPCPGCGGAHGRPAVAAAPLHFSLSHSSGVALVGVAAVPLGVDVERLPRPEAVEVCTPALHPDEQAELAAAGDAQRGPLFGRIWTRKEAFLKGIGTGLSRSPAEDYLGVDTTRHPSGWTVVDVPCDDTHAAAVAVRGAAPLSVNVRRLAQEWLGAGGGTCADPTDQGAADPPPTTPDIPGERSPEPFTTALAC
ncbi:4'-phosphopantetheinyl transferase family protein [Streptomyces regalis]|uniref:4'-phosphopantetheinyl transferase family protein n=1 Tax=Streptomyces regalis TaxID=68262 RepID=UPI0007C82AC9|nr:4'-phosphopantetheinyl transferase superfamily protein [Streptomyces regalis]